MALEKLPVDPNDPNGGSTGGGSSTGGSSTGGDTSPVTTPTTEPLAWYQDKRFLLFAILLIGGIWVVVNVIAPLFQ